MKSGIYKITTPSGKCYIGQTRRLTRRWAEHKRQAQSKIPKMLICKALKKYGADRCTFEIIEHCEIHLLNERECYWILFYKSLSPSGYNKNDGGSTNKIITQSTREKLSRKATGRPSSNKGRPMSDDQRRILSEIMTGRQGPNKGKSWPQEMKDKISRSLSDRVLPQITKDRISERTKGVPKGPMSEYTKGKLRECKLGTKSSEATKMKISVSLVGNQYRKGIPQTPETLQKIKDTKARNKALRAEAERLRQKQEALDLQHEMAS